MSVVRVAVGVIEADGKYLLAKRPKHVHKGGLWEFPGGKIEEGESTQTALSRELFEELGIEPCEEGYFSLIKILHHYPEKSVELDVFRVTKFFGEAYGKEGQEIRWVTADEMGLLDFPEANKAIIDAITLPDIYLFTEELVDVDKGIDLVARNLRAAAENLLSKTDGLVVRLRTADGVIPTLEQLNHFVDVCHQFKAIAFAGLYPEVGNSKVDGVHLSSTEVSRLYDGYSDLKDVYQSLKSSERYIACSCHDTDEITRAESIGADLLCISPVQKTASHPEQQALGWEKFSTLLLSSKVPAYGLGGLTAEDINKAQSFGAQGIAGIRLWWRD